MDVQRGLADLEVLKYQVCDAEIRKLAEEAINCYYNGAYRSSINCI